VTRLAFTDPVSGRVCELVVPPGGRLSPQGEAKIGVAHPGCGELADLALEFDAFYCARCGRNGRISGAWAAGVIKEAAGG